MIDVEVSKNLLSKWNDTRTDPIKAIKAESDIINYVRENIADELTKYDTDMIQSISTSVKDLFTIYEEVKTEVPKLINDRVAKTSSINALHKLKNNWGLNEENANKLQCLLKELDVIDNKIKVYNHIVNFSIPSALNMYIEATSIVSKIEFLTEMNNFLNK